MNRVNQDQYGYTLVEILVTIIVGAILVSSISLVVSNQSFLAQRGRDVTIANSYAENKVEELRSVGYLGLTDGTTNITSELPSELGSPRSASLVISTVTTGIKKAVLTISYNEQGATRTTSYTTLVGELGVGQY